MAYIPVLLTPSSGATVSNLPFFEMYYTAGDPHATVKFSFEIIRADNPGDVIIISDTDLGWNKPEGYSSGEIAVYTLGPVNQLVDGKAYNWRAQALEGSTWSGFTTLSGFNVLLYQGASDVGTFVISSDAFDAMKPQLLSVDDNPTHGNHSTITMRTPIISWNIPYGLGTGIHFRVEAGRLNKSPDMCALFLI